MTIYKATTRFLGADGPTERYFKTKEKAQAFVNGPGEGIGEVEKCECTINIGDGMTWADIEYWGGKVEEV